MFSCLLFISLSGCGGNPTGSGGGGGSSTSGPNNGTVSGHIYSINMTTGTLTGQSGYIVTASTESMTYEVSCVSDSNGAYKLQGLSSGTIEVTVTSESSGNFEAWTIVANSDTFNFIVDSSADTGGATIKGTVEGFYDVPDPVSDAFSVRCYSKSGRSYSYSWMFDPATLTYEVTNAPNDGSAYVIANWEDATTVTVHKAYDKVNTYSGGQFTRNISFEPEVELSGEVTNLPSGFTCDWGRVQITAQNKTMLTSVGDYDTSLSPIIRFFGLTPLKSGDQYRVQVEGAGPSGNNYFEKYFYGKSAGPGQTLDMNATSMPTSLIVYPSDGATLTGSVTIEWNQVPGANYYKVSLYDFTVDKSWYAYTYGTKIKMPACVASWFGGGDECDINVYAYKLNNPVPIYNPSPSIDTALYDFTYEGYIGVTLESPII